MTFASQGSALQRMGVDDTAGGFYISTLSYVFFTEYDS